MFTGNVIVFTDYMIEVASRMKPEIERYGKIEMTEQEYTWLKYYVRSYYVYGEESLRNKSFDISRGNLYDSDLKDILKETLDILSLEQYYTTGYIYPDILEY